VITLTQPKVPEAEIRESQKGFQWVILGLERTTGVLTGVQRGPMGSPGLLELSALSSTQSPSERFIWSVLLWHISLTAGVPYWSSSEPGCTVVSPAPQCSDGSEPLPGPLCGPGQPMIGLAVTREVLGRSTRCKLRGPCIPVGVRLVRLDRAEVGRTSGPT
jgi:hypothetical protein